MPHKAYHGKTGRVFNVTKRALGVVVNKRVKGRIFAKRISVRVEHVCHSKCRQDFLDRVKVNEVKRKEAKAAGVKVNLKRQPLGPRPAHIVSTENNTPEIIGPVPYEFIA